METVQVGDHYEVWDYNRNTLFVGTYTDCEQFIDETTEYDEAWP